MFSIKPIVNKLSYILCACLLLSAQAFATDVQKYTRNDLKAFVLEARDFALKNDKDATLKEFVRPGSKFIRGSLYIFAFDFKNICLAHIKPNMIGSAMGDLKDINGVRIVGDMTEIAKAKPEGDWLTYIWQNPETQQPEKKYSFAIKIDDTYWIGAGLYESAMKK